MVRHLLGGCSKCLALARQVGHAEGLYLDEVGVQTLVSIELAEVYTAQGKWGDAMRLVEDFYVVLEGWGMHREGLAFWILFRDSLTAHAWMRATLDAAAFRAAELYYHRAWRHPLGAVEASRVS